MSIFDFFTKTPTSRTVTVASKASTLRDKEKSDRAGAVALASAYTKATESRKAYRARYDHFRTFYLVDAIVEGIF